MASIRRAGVGHRWTRAEGRTGEARERDQGWVGEDGICHRVRGSSYLSGKNRKAGVQRSGVLGFATAKLKRTLAPLERGV